MGPSLDYVVELILEKELVSKLAVSAAKESVRKIRVMGKIMIISSMYSLKMTL